MFSIELAWLTCAAAYICNVESKPILKAPIGNITHKRQRCTCTQTCTDALLRKCHCCAKCGADV